MQVPSNRLAQKGTQLRYVLWRHCGLGWAYAFEVAREVCTNTSSPISTRTSTTGSVLYNKTKLGIPPQENRAQLAL